MKKLTICLTLVMFIVASLSGIVFAKKGADLDFGTKFDNGSYWGIEYLGKDKTMNSYLHVQKDGSNTTITGPYIDDGQDVTTVIGNKLGVNYSPYVAKFHDHLIGFQVKGYKLDSQMVSLNFGGTYELAFEKEKFFPGDTIVPSQGNFAINANGNLDALDMNIALLRYTDIKDDPEADYNSYINYALSVEMDLIDGFTVDGLFANYGELDASLYEITGNYKVNDDFKVYGGFRNSDDAINGGSEEAIQGEGARFVADANPINTIYKRDKGYNVGMELKFNPANYMSLIMDMDNTLNVDYNSTNPDERDDLDDSIDSSLVTEVKGFTVTQKNFILLTEADTELNKMYYDLSVVTPEYNLPGANDVAVTGKFNYDYDVNYEADGETNTYATAGVNMKTTQDLWRLSNVTLQGLVFADIANFMQEDLATDVKYALMGKYDAPNGIKFRVQYYGFEYAGNNKDVKGNDRYAPYTWYGNDTYGGGVRVAVGIPF